MKKEEEEVTQGSEGKMTKSKVQILMECAG